MACLLSLTIRALTDVTQVPPTCQNVHTSHLYFTLHKKSFKNLKPAIRQLIANVNNEQWQMVLLR